MTNNDKPGRRAFLKSASLAAMAAPGGAQQAREVFNAIQMGPHTMLDEGIEHTLDLIQETAAINALMIYSHTYHGDLRKPPQMLATDHGVPPRDMRNRKLPSVWVRHHEQAFNNTPLRRQSVDRSFEYSARALFAEVLPSVRKRGMYRC